MSNERPTKNFRITKDAFIALRKAIRYLASRDSDHATKKNYAGFNKVDSKIGHTLARKEKWTEQDVRKAIELANRYRRQLPERIRKALPESREDRRFRERKRKRDFASKHEKKQGSRQFPHGSRSPNRKKKKEEHHET